MNFVTYNYFVLHISKIRAPLSLFLTVLVCIYLVGCGDQVRLPSAEQLAEFEGAGPVRPTVDMDRLVRAKRGEGAYRVVPGEVLELTMPTILQVVTAEGPASPDKTAPYVCRVSESGSITLPVVGEIEAAGKTLAQIESAVIDAYHPEYAVTRPSVFARVLEYKTAKVSITGAVAKPGVYELRSDQMSLVALLMEAGGIVDEGAALIRINHPDDIVAGKYETLEQLSEPKQIEFQLTFLQLEPPGTIGRLTIKYDETTLVITGFDITSERHRQALLAKLRKEHPNVSTTEVKQRLCAFPGCSILDTRYSSRIEHRETSIEQSEPLVLPVKGLNIPFADVALQDGDSVIVERLTMPLFTLLGLVNKPGNFPYPPDVQYNLMQALGFAGGLDPTAEPRYATIYRLKADGTITSATFEVANGTNGSKLTYSMNTLIKPGDIVAVEHTPRTRTKVFLDRVFRVNFGVYAPLYLLGGYGD